MGKYTRTGRFRSRFELNISRQIVDAGAKWKYELFIFPYYSITRYKMLCENCGPVKGLLRREYLPDFFLSNGVVIEAKGRFTSADRNKLRAIVKQHPKLDLRIVFQYDAKLSKTSNTRYSEWAEKEGIPWAVKKIPEEWFLHSDQAFPANKKRWRALFPANPEIK